MKITALPVSLAIVALISGCASSTVGFRGQIGTPGTAMSFQETHESDAAMLEQTAALEALMRDIVRSSTVKHAAIGAAMGCGIFVLATANASGCIRAATAGGVVGAVSGNLAGKREVARRMELVSPNELVRGIRSSNEKLDQITTNLPQLLSRQEKTVATLAQRRSLGELSQGEYSAQVASIRTRRAELAEALTLSSKQAKLAQNNLADAAAHGQTGLEWHIRAIEQLEREALSARSTISLL
ncbi:hypothetical protein [Sulfitobacter litoralis]|uniref:hypothetical protein n=1 Tax=Sulfitobacter litoralis TaxID=335975 RepID=UPI002B271B40|nr:hypothetical protein [Sulfitobacter litoralis]